MMIEGDAGSTISSVTLRAAAKPGFTAVQLAAAHRFKPVATMITNIFRNKRAGLPISYKHFGVRNIDDPEKAVRRLRTDYVPAGAIAGLRTSRLVRP
jgi:hypothetical protein